MQIVKTKDGSFTTFNTEFNEHHHSTNDGALNESLYKHILPALKHVTKNKITILDICFGLGFNTFTTLYYLKQLAQTKEITVHSPELDIELIHSLNQFPYPKEFAFLQPIIDAIANTYMYESPMLNIYVYPKDARLFLNESSMTFDIIYQDAFSPKKNPTLWTQEYFIQLFSRMNSDGILTTYSSATPVRVGLYNSGFILYENRHEKVRTGTLATKRPLKESTPIDMVLKIERSSNPNALHD
jgi:tRNA U34 5-methylaminomethyl-2-thiouridine-forming methyltransferase MnmC